ncbi:MAG: hypothetical protein ACTSQE_12545, partial [Candidatus Heimdallarchaeaceae archaeon]
MSYFSNYLKNVKSGYNYLKDEAENAIARTRTPSTYASGLDYSNSPSASSLLAGSDARVQKDLDTLHSSQGYTDWQKKTASGAYTLSGADKQKSQQDSVFSGSRKIRKVDEDGEVYYVKPPVSGGESRQLNSAYGMSGIGDSEKYAGMSQAQAEKAAKADQDFYKTQTSEGTSYTFNAETLSKTNNIMNDFQFKLKDIASNPWEGKGSIETSAKANIKLYEGKLAKLFEDPEEFNQAYNSDQGFRDKMDGFQSMGGDINAVMAGIKPTPTMAEHVGENVQDLQTYRAIGDSVSEQKSFNTLIPENELDQSRVKELSNIPRNYEDAFFGTPTQIGIHEERIAQATEEMRIVEQETNDNEDNARAEAKLQQKRADLNYDIESSTIETNRLNAKNYMTGMLAKLGALNTTGAAPAALATLEQRYQQQAQVLRSNYKFNKQALDIKLDDYINGIDIDLDYDILKIEADLTNDREKIYKEVLKLQNKANADIYKIQSQFAKTYRTQLEKYTKSATKNSDKYIKSMSGIASSYDVNSVNN